MERTVENILPSTSRTVLYTPRTPRTRERQRFSLAVGPTLIQEQEEDEDAALSTDNLDELLGQTWTIFGVSTLFGFQSDEVRLKQYAKRLREEVANTLSQEDVVYNAKFVLMEDIAPRPSPTDPPPIKIQVYAKNDSREENVEKCIYKGMLLSWRTMNTESNTGNSIRLPLLLCRGTRSGMECVHSILCRMFDCMVIALPAKEDDLAWLVPIVITSNKEEQPRSTDEIRMEYTIPGLPVTDTITVKFRILDLIKMLSVITKGPSDETAVEDVLHLEHIEKFHEILNTQMLEVAGIQLGLCTLHKINMPGLTIMENRMKVMNTETMHRVLLYLNEKALDTFHTITYIQNFDV